MIRMLLVGYCYGIRSERRLCDEVNFNLAYRWFCRTGLEDDVPDHSTFFKNRHGRYRDSDLFRYVFDTVVLRCMGEGLVKGEGFAVDASFIRADVIRQRAVRSDEPMDWGPSRIPQTTSLTLNTASSWMLKHRPVQPRQKFRRPER